MRVNLFALLVIGSVAIGACTAPGGQTGAGATPETAGGRSEVSISDTVNPSTGERTIFVSSRGMTLPEGESDSFPMSFSVYYKKTPRAPDRYYGVIQMIGLPEGRSALLRVCPAVAWSYGGIYYSKAILDYSNTPELGRQNEFLIMEFTRTELANIVKAGTATYFVDFAGAEGSAPGGCISPTAVSKAEVEGLSRMLAMTEAAPVAPETPAQP